MKSGVKPTVMSAAMALVLLLGGCAFGEAPGVDLRKVGESCRAPGDHTWSSPIHARVLSNAIIWDAVNLDYDSTNDPSVSCVLLALKAPSDVIAQVEATKTVGPELSASWHGYNLVWQGIALKSGLKGFITISVEKAGF